MLSNGLDNHFKESRESHFEDSPFNIYDAKTNSFNLERGFLPKVDPIKELPIQSQSPIKMWEKFAMELPKWLTTGRIRAEINTLPPFDISSLQSATEYEKAMVILSYLGHAYVWGTNPVIDSIPKNLAVAWYEVASRIGRPPVLSYASYALYNWRRIKPALPIELGNIVLLHNFLGGIDEEWFILVHVDIEAKAAKALKVLIPMQQAVYYDQLSQVLVNLEMVANSLSSMCQTLDRMPENCDPYIYYNRVRPYIHGWKDNPALPEGLLYEGVEEYHQQRQKFKGETGAQSSIIPSLDAALGIEHEESPLKNHLIEMQEYMPPLHRQFINALQKGPSIRDYVLKHFREHPSLREIYNECIRLLHRFRSTHLKYAALYIQKQSQTSPGNPTHIGTGGTPYIPYLRGHFHDTEKYLI